MHMYGVVGTIDSVWFINQRGRFIFSELNAFRPANAQRLIPSLLWRYPRDVVTSASSTCTVGYDLGRRGDVTPAIKSRTI